MQLPATLVGKQGKCPACGQMTTIIAASGDQTNSGSIQQFPNLPPMSQQPASSQQFPQQSVPPQQFSGQATPQQSNIGNQAKETFRLAGETAKSIGGAIYDRAKKGAEASKKSQFGGFAGASSSQPVGNNRYPNLSKYLQILDAINRIGFTVCLALLIVVVVGVMVIGVLNVIFGWGVLEGVLMCVFAPILGVICYYMLIWARIVAYASSELIRVFMDTEKNTRSR
tara:strand:- start:245 stop:922 length:678 start_codon:yes stop_codon:yes gene_type:complete